MSKPKVAFYWAASCGGCEIGVLAIHEKILDVAAAVDIVFWPVAIDVKYKDVEAMEDGAIDICFFNGAIRTGENLEMAHLLRRKSKVLVAFGACAHEGGIPGLANFATREEIFDRAFLENPSLENPGKLVPQTSSALPEGELRLPEFHDAVRTLGQTVDVDYFMPGCPPVSGQILAVVGAALGGQLPVKGSTVGAGERTLCDECKRTKHEKMIGAIKRPHQVVINPDECILEQGVLCMGPATRAGCGAQCIDANMPCRGCYGPPEGVHDQGAKMCSALASIIDCTDLLQIPLVMDQIDDPAGYFYRFGLPASTLGRVQR